MPPDARKQRLQPVDRLQEAVDDLGRRSDGPGAEGLHHVFEPVGHRAHPAQADDGGGPLQRVGVAEDGAHDLGGGAGLQRQEMLRQPAEADFGLLGEQLEEPGPRRGRHATAGTSSVPESMSVTTTEPTA